MRARQFLIGLGSNLGNRSELISAAIDKLGAIKGVRLLAISEAVDSDPVGYTAQPNFLNLCTAIVYNGSSADLLQETQNIESQLGRIRTIKDGPRTIDIDLLFCEDEKVESANLVLPHPRWQQRGFIIFPLRQILQSPALAKEKCWDWLRSEVAQSTIGNDGLRIWQGPTPWNKTTS